MLPPLPSAVLLDYGCVISRPQSDRDLRRIEAAAGLEPDVLWQRYWDLRIPYDEGQADDAYWSAVLGRPLTPAELARLVELDVASWLQTDDRMTEALPVLAARGMRLGLLSNAPTVLARAVADQPWTAPFTGLVFSADVGSCKPAHAAYVAAADALGVAPADVLFVDDRPENVAGAEAAGMRALLHRDTATTLAELLGVGA